MRNPGKSDFETELKILDDDIAELDKTVFQAAVNSELETRYVYRLYQRNTLTGDLRELRRVEQLIDRGLERTGPAEDLCLLKANLNFKLHRLAETKRALALAPALASRPQGQVLLAEIAFQEGDYAGSRKKLEELEPTWDVLARLAHFEFKLGDPQEAERLYLAAEDELTAKEMRSFAWLELQRGILRLSQGQIGEALEHYACADRAYTGHWLTQEHMADALAAAGDTEKAISLYREVLLRVNKPEVAHKLGELTGDEKLLGRALAGFMESAKLGEVHYYHHLTEYFADTQIDGEEAVAWAMKDIALRDNFNTQMAAAWALHKAGRPSAALPYVEMALVSGVRDAGILAKAAQVYEGAGQKTKAHELEHKAAALNPRHVHVHVH